MNLLELAKASNSLVKPNHSILLYGPPKTGKTRLVGTAARIAEVENIYWFDGENGIETLLHMGLTEEQLKKVTVFHIPDTRDKPRFIETILKALSKNAVTICDVHGKVDCVECQTPEDKAQKKFTGTVFDLKKCTHQDLIVIDSGSQLGDSALNLACIGQPVEFKPGWDEWGIQVKYLSDIMTTIQAAAFTNFIMITHVIPIEEEFNGVKTDKLFPLCGTKAFCQKVAKYFGTVIYVDFKLGKHFAASKSTYSPNKCTTGSRVNAEIEKNIEPDMKTILIEGGILK